MTTKFYNVWMEIEEVTVSDNSEDYKDLTIDEEMPVKIASFHSLEETLRFMENMYGYGGLIDPSIDENGDNS